MDGVIQYFFESNLFGYQLIGIKIIDDQSALKYITGFFNEEKKTWKLSSKIFTTSTCSNILV